MLVTLILLVSLSSYSSKNNELIDIDENYGYSNCLPGDYQTEPDDKIRNSYIDSINPKLVERFQKLVEHFPHLEKILRRNPILDRILNIQ